MSNQIENMLAAFEILTEVIEEEINKINNAGAEAFKENDYNIIPQLLERANKLIEIHDSVDKLKNDFKNNFIQLPYPENPDNSTGQAEISTSSKRYFGRAVYGSRTYIAEYAKPILTAIIELGGKGKVKEILEKVEAIMKHKLNQVDYEELPSSGTSRWQNAAQWERHNMVKNGLLSDSSPRGVWEITDKGRDYLNKMHREEE